MKTIILILTMLSFALAINPPNKGAFPARLAKILHDNPQYIKYGDPGWMKHIAAEKAAKNRLKLAKIAQDKFKLPVLLGALSDISGTFSTSDFQKLLFDDNPTGTMTSYYNEISYGKFSLTGTVFGWFTADQNKSYYLGDGNGLGGTFPQNAKGYVYNIVSKADASVDFSQFDNDGPDGIPNSGDDDGYADAVCIVYPQAGPDWSPGNDSFWPHMSTLGSNAYTTNDAAANGGTIIVNAFFVCAEEAGGGSGNGQIRPIGVFVHEFGHVLGLPDLYDRTDSQEGPDYEDSEGIGEWCLMASGSWGGDGAHTETPAHMSSWCKIQLGWINPTYITSQTNNLTINQMETYAEAYILWEDPYAGSRYFLIENRQKTGFDQYLNGSGLLIYHVDENRRWGDYAWSAGYVNDDETHKLVDLEEADGLANLDNNVNRGDAGDPYPGTSGNTDFTDNTVPSARDYNNQATGVSVKNISASSSIMTADLTPRQVTGYIVKYDEEGITGWAIGATSDVDSWGGVLFDAVGGGILKSVDVGFVYSNLDYEIFVYSSFSGTQPGTLLSSESGHIDNAGWYTIAFTDDINITSGQNFFIALKILKKDHAFSIDAIGSKDGHSYYSGDGTNYSSTSQIGEINIRARIQTNPVTFLKTDRDMVNHFYLKQNYPNPFNPQTVINYQLAENSKVTLNVFDISGRLVRTLVNSFQEAGAHSVIFDGIQLASGVYIYKIVTDKFSDTRKMLLVK